MHSQATLKTKWVGKRPPPGPQLYKPSPVSMEYVKDFFLIYKELFWDNFLPSSQGKQKTYKRAVIKHEMKSPEM